MTLQMPPAATGLATTMKMVHDVTPLFVDLYATHGPVVEVRLPYPNPLETYLLMQGPTAHRWVLKDQAPHMSNRIGYGFLLDALDTGLLVIDGMPHQRTRQSLSVAFRKERYRHFIAAMQKNVNQVLDQWECHPAGAKRQIYPDMRHITQLNMATVILGLDDGERLFQELNHYWLRFAEHLMAPMKQLIPGYTKAKEHIDRLLRECIGQEQHAVDKGSQNGNVIALLLWARKNHEIALSDEALLAQVRMLAWAGFETTAYTCAVALALLAQHPQIQEMLYRESKPYVDRGISDVTDLGGKLLEAVIKEAQRLGPIPVFMCRGVTQTLTYEDEWQGGTLRYLIPAGSKILLCPRSAHRLPAVFPDPNRFDPERWLRNPSPPADSWIGFGGGPRVCIGAGFAQTEIKLIMMNLIHRFRLTADPQADATPLDHNKLPVIQYYPR
jgi:cytochrome P450